MHKSQKDLAREEIGNSMSLCHFCMRRIGLSFKKPKNMIEFTVEKLMFLASVLAICYHVFSEIVYIGLTLANSPRVEDVVPLFHTFGYGALSIAKVFTLWYKKDLYGQLLDELADIWPVPPLSEDAELVKAKSLAALKLAHQWYFVMNLSGVWFYNLTPIGIYLYKLLWSQEEAIIGFVWMSWYPFNKHQTFNHVAVYLFEVFAGQTCVWIMLATDLLFSAMASHIGLLLKLLRRALEALPANDNTDQDHYRDITDKIKLHQRLIRYCGDLEQSFSMVNLINIIMSSLNICCVVFVIVLLEPFVAISNKLFLISALIQVGMLCWYADDIMTANADIAVAAGNGEWYRTSPKCQRALLFLIKRSQKPIAFTAKGFTNISLVTYSAILYRSYSYFTLLYTMYRDT